MPSVLVVIGSERAGGFNQMLADVAIRQLSESVSVTTLPTLATLPHLREDLDEPGGNEHVDAFREAVRASDAVLLVTPEYNGGPPSLIKNAIDHSSRPREDCPIAGKPAAVIGATPSPGETRGAREALLRGLAVAGADPVETTYGIGAAYRHLGPGGYDDEVTEGVRTVVAALLARISVAA